MAQAGKRFGSVRQLSSGRWQARYTHEGASHKAPRTFATQAEAERWLRTRHTELDTGARLLLNPKRAGAATFGQYAERWLASRSVDLKPRTVVLYRSLLDRNLLPAFGKRSMAGITPDVVRDWYDSFGKTTPTARAHSYALLRTIFNAALRESPPLAESNPCRIRGGSFTRRRHRINPATMEELQTIVEHMPRRLQAMVLLAAWGGFRFGELTELRRMDLDGQTVHVSRAVVRLPGVDGDTPASRRRPVFEVGAPKSGAGIRSVVLPAAIMPAIEEHLALMEDKRPAALLFPADSGEHLAVSTLNRYWFPAREAAGRPDLRWHDLRHTQAVLAAQSGATLAELMQRMGHSTVVATLRYQHAAQGRDAQIAAALSKLMEARQ